MFSFGIRIILIVLVLAGLVALVGNYIGRKIGRKRLRLLGLRPRHTATFFTILTGCLIALSTISFLLIVSQDVRTAMFGLEDLKQELASRTQLLQTTKDELADRAAEKETIDQQLKIAKKEVDELQRTKNSLTKEISETRRGDLLFKVDEVILASLIQAGPEEEKLKIGLSEILSAADNYVRSFGEITEKHLIVAEPEDFSRALAILKQRRGENVVRLIVTRNTLFGETVNVRFDIQENKLVYNKNEEVSLLKIGRGLSVPELEQKIKLLLDQSKTAAQKRGMLPDLHATVQYSEIFNLAKKINAYKKPVELKTFAKNDIYTIGPLEVDFKIYYQ